ncbi:MAG: hypothetical protein ABWY22_05435, partial [Flavobacterium sp.]
MKKITILVFLIFISCNDQRKNTKMNVEKKISKEKVIENIAVLRKCGFYEEFQNLTDTEVYNKLHSKRIKEYSEIFEKPYDPGMNIDEFDLAYLDKQKMIYMDLESDVGAGNKVYKDVIKMFSLLSKGTFNPENIVEKWQ